MARQYSGGSEVKTILRIGELGESRVTRHSQYSLPCRKDPGMLRVASIPSAKESSSSAVMNASCGVCFLEQFLREGVPHYGLLQDLAAGRLLRRN